MSDYEINSDASDNTTKLNNVEILKVLIYNSKLYEETGSKNFVSTWLPFPTTQEAVQSALKEIGVDGKNYNRFLIDDCESNIKGLADSLPESADIDEINYLAVKLQNITDYNVEKLCAVIDSKNYYLEIAELINFIDNIESYDLQPAFSAKEYGEFLLGNTLDEIGTIANEKLTDADAYGVLMSRLDEIGQYVDTQKYGSRTANLEGGSFSDFGYLTKQGETADKYKGKDDVPQEYKVFAYPDDEHSAGLYKIENTDITDFAYKLHIFPGDFTGDLSSNMRLLAKGDVDEYILVMNRHDLRISRAAEVYHNDSEINEYLRNFPHDARAYLLSVDNRENNRINGTIVMVDCGALSADVDKNTLSYTSVTACMPNGETESYSRELWEAAVLENIDMTDWKIDFVFGDSQANSFHYAEFFISRLQEAEAIRPDTLLGYLNAEYMQEANFSQPGMIRIPMETARTMLLNEDAPVYRLKPHSIEKLSIIAAATNKLSNTHFCEFAVKKEDEAGIDKACRRETEKLNCTLVEKDIPKGRNASLEEH